MRLAMRCACGSCAPESEQVGTHTNQRVCRVFGRPFSRTSALCTQSACTHSAAGHFGRGIYRSVQPVPCSSHPRMARRLPATVQFPDGRWYWTDCRRLQSTARCRYSSGQCFRGCSGVHTFWLPCSQLRAGDRSLRDKRLLAAAYAIAPKRTRAPFWQRNTLAG